MGIPPFLEMVWVFQKRGEEERFKELKWLEPQRGKQPFNAP
jgi:hypothetical protein